MIGWNRMTVFGILKSMIGRRLDYGGIATRLDTSAAGELPP